MTRMTKLDDWRTAARYGMPFGVGLALLGCGIALLRTVNSTGDFKALPYIWLMAAVICAFLAGFIAARANGLFTLGVDAGALACAASSEVLRAWALAVDSRNYWSQTHKSTHGPFLDHA